MTAIPLFMVMVKSEHKKNINEKENIMGFIDNGMERLMGAMEKKAEDVRRSLRGQVKNLTDQQVLYKLERTDGMAHEVLEEEAEKRGLI